MAKLSVFAERILKARPLNFALTSDTSCSHPVSKANRADTK